MVLSQKTQFLWVRQQQTQSKTRERMLSVAQTSWPSIAIAASIFQPNPTNLAEDTATSGNNISFLGGLFKIIFFLHKNE